MRQKILWITRTAVLTALLVILQGTTASAGQLATGSCVNAVLATAALLGGPWCGVTVAAISPVFAFLLGIGPQLIPIVPAIAAGNIVFVLLLRFVCGSASVLWRKVLAWLAAAAAKAAALYLLVVVLLCNVLALPQPQIEKFTAMFSLPQLITALIGGGIALIFVPELKKALRS